VPGIARKGSDYAKGVIVGPSAKTVFANGKPVALIGDTVAPHGKAPHTKPALVSNGASKCLVEGQIPAKQGTSASCGHTVTPGSPNVKVP
jgi:uncharacterized Zn-binding protein involved in type VI secretion